MHFASLKLLKEYLLYYMFSLQKLQSCYIRCEVFLLRRNNCDLLYTLLGTVLAVLGKFEKLDLTPIRFSGK